VPEPGPPRVAIGRFANLIGLSLSSILGDSGVDVVASGLGYSGLIGALVKAPPPQVVVIDEELAVSAVIAGLRSRRPGLGIVVITQSPRVGSHLLRARLKDRAGISCLSTDTSAGDLLAAVHLAAEGQELPSADLDRRAPRIADFASLTPREGEVLSDLLQRRRPAQIAAALHITPATVQTHIRRIYRKLGVRSREQLLALELPPLD